MSPYIRRFVNGGSHDCLLSSATGHLQPCQRKQLLASQSALLLRTPLSSISFNYLSAPKAAISKVKRRQKRLTKKGRTDIIIGLSLLAVCLPRCFCERHTHQGRRNEQFFLPKSERKKFQGIGRRRRRKLGDDDHAQQKMPHSRMRGQMEISCIAVTASVSSHQSYCWVK